MTMSFVFLVATVLAPTAEPSIGRSEAHVSLGMNSCTASACHGGSIVANEKGKAWNSSYTVWATKDPHADAFAVLLGERSRKIVARLTAFVSVDPKKDPNKDAKHYRAFLEQRCMACHATVTESQHSTDGFAEDGVSCASCHGVAGDWLGRDHAGRVGKGVGGMTNTKELLPRAKVCVDCHVGSPIRDGQPRRDVDHDLVAAGHPRLNFEFWAFLDNLPKHWDLDRDQNRIRKPENPKKSPGNFVAEAWVTGQFVSANAALELLESRAKTNLWPEFSEISCYSCHHDLRSPSFRQKLFDRTPPSDRRPPLGSLVWGAWYSPMVRRYQLTQPAGAASDEASWNDLERAMNSLRPESNEVQRLSKDLGKRLATREVAVKRLSESVAGGPAPRADWDEVAQWYLAAVAWHQALQEEVAGNGQLADQPKIKQRMQTLQECQATLEKLRGQLESPPDFDPTGESFQQAVKQLLQQLATLEG